MDSDALLTSLTRAWSRAVATSNAEDLPREYVDVLLPLMPETAGDLLRLHRDRGFGELFLLLDHAPLLARHARDQFLQRALTAKLPVPPVELIAAGALGVPPEERGPFRALALDAIAAEVSPKERLDGLLAWSRAEPADVAQGLVAEARALIPHVVPSSLPRLVSRFGDTLDAPARRAVLDRIQRVARARRSPELTLARCALSAADRRAAIADEAIARAAEMPGEGIVVTAIVAMKLVGFDAVRQWFERHLRELDSLRDLTFLLDQVGAHMPPEMLALAEERARSLDGVLWHRILWLRQLACFDPARRDALRAELRPLVDRVVGDALAGHRIDPDDYGEYDNLDVLRASIAMVTSGAFEGDERRRLQRQALALVERTDTGVERRYEVAELPWSELGAALDPSLRAEAARVALTIRHRPSALKALGELVAKLPVESRHLALLGMARLADGAAPEGLASALAALEAALALPTRRVGDHPAAREALRAALAQERSHLTPMRYELVGLAQLLQAVCGEAEAEWSERLARFIEGQRWDVEALLTAFEVLAPSLKVLGGAATVRALMAQLRVPIAPAEIALPWTQAATGDFQA